MQRVVDAFEKAFGHRPGGVWSAPGRVNLIGEHTDYNDGLALPFAIQLRTYAAIGLRSDMAVRAVSVQSPDEAVTTDVMAIVPGTNLGWAGYALGMAWGLGIDGGFDVAVDGRVPVGAGLSSSSALECAVGLGLVTLFGIEIDRMDLARAAQRTENRIVGAPTGMMDQVASLQGRAGMGILFDVAAGSIRRVPLDLDAAELEIVVIDTRVSHAHAAGEYAVRRRECEEAARRLGRDSLRGITVEDLAATERRLADSTLVRRVRHVVTENDRVLRVSDALARHDWPAVGTALTESHHSLAGDFAVSCPELDITVETALDAGAIGARMVGGGFGGSVIALIPSSIRRHLTASVASRFSREGWPTPRAFTAHPSAGARLVRRFGQETVAR